jgi:hypothetical protein
VYIIPELGYNDSNIEKGLPMPINTDLLIAAAILQDSFVDKDGTPMAGGTVTCYQDNSRTTLKNWYYQSGLPGAYTYVRLPNPLTLSAAGTICDINGVDTIPFFYPYSELDQNTKQPYYITIVNYAKTNQITRQNFPFIVAEEDAAGQGSHENYIINNGFWRNVGSVAATGTVGTAFSATICPSQHDGFRLPDMTFFKNTGGGMDTITFNKFPLTINPILTDDITPEFYINHTCTNAVTGELQKAYFFPISLHVNTLVSVGFSFTLQAQNLGGTAPGQDTINAYIYQDTGTGTTAPTPFAIGSITANSSWDKYTFNSIFPSTNGLTLSQGGDDALYLVLQMPLNIACSLNFTRPSIYLTNDVPMNSFETYDQVDAVINSPRTGDIRTSMNAFSPWGWVPANDGTIGNTGSGATTRANTDTWQLYNLLWSAVSQTWAPVTGGRGANAYADFTANKPMALPKALGRAIATAGSGAGLTPTVLGQATGAEANSVTLVPANLPPHSHTYVYTTVGSGFGFGFASGTNLQNPTGATGNGPGTSTPFSVPALGPSLYVNVFFKL